MATQLQLRGGTTPENLTFTGAQREVTIDTDKNALVVHDGVTAGGFPVATEGQVVDGTDFYSEDIAGGSTVNQYVLVPNPTTNVPNAYYPGATFSFVTVNPNTGPSSANFQGLGVKNIKIAGGSDPAPGDINGRVSLIFDSVNDWFELQLKASQDEPQIRHLTASVLGNAMTITLSPCVIDFRAASLGSGVVTRRNVVAPIAVTIPAGATLGTVSAVLGRLVVVAIDNAGTVELAVANISGQTNLDETSLINTVAITSGSSSASTFYSGSARSGVPYRVVGFVESTQAAAGTWTAAPSRVQGQGGQAIVDPISPARITQATAQSTTSGTSIDFTSIPSWVKKISVTLNSVSTSGTSGVSIQLGTSSGVDATGYAGCVAYGATGVQLSAFSTAFDTVVPRTAAGLAHGTISLALVSLNSWVASFSMGTSGSGSSFSNGGGSKTLSGTLDRVRITTGNGTDVFDAGTANIIYEG